MKKSKPNNYAFIDSQNLNLGVRDQGWKLDFGRFRVYLKDKYQATKAFLFIGYVAGNQALYTQLQKDDFLVIFKPTLELRREKKIKVKGNVDAELILHSMIEWRNFDKAIIVSGDGDFHCLIEYMVEQKKLLKLISPSRKSFSSLLRKFGQYVIFVEDLKRKLKK
ncbi:MAG: NYN domain-containing protein [Patescibacteria group bacterium]